MLKYSQNAYKLELDSERHCFQISLFYNFLENKVTKLPYRHLHAKYEVIFARYEDGRPGRFLVIPPNFEHYTYYEEKSERIFATSFQFAVEEKALSETMSPGGTGGVLENFLRLDLIAVIEDSFHGGQRVASIRRELQERPAAYFETVHAELTLLMVELARRLPVEPPMKKEPPTRSLDEIRLDVIDSYFFDHLSFPDCKREDLARLLCISERQLSRILERHYGMSFRERLLRTRMEVAEARRKTSSITAERLSELVGYSSPPAFLAAYRSYFGYPFKRQQNKE